MEHADRFLRRFYIEKGMFGSLSLTFIFYRPPLPELVPARRAIMSTTPPADEDKSEVEINNRTPAPAGVLFLGERDAA